MSDEVIAALSAGFRDEAPHHVAPIRKASKPSLKHPSSIVGVGRTAQGPAVLVTDHRARAAGLKWGSRYVDGPLEVVPMGVPQTLPLKTRAQWWGWKTPAIGKLIGGKTFYRREDPKYGSASGGTLSLVVRDTQGREWVCGNVHCLAAMLGTDAPPEHHTLWEVEWGAPFAQVQAFHQITTSPDHPNFLDFGIARIHPDWQGEVCVNEILDVGTVTGTATMMLGEIGLMNGATTGRRDKPVVAIDVVSRIGYGWIDTDTEEAVEGEFVLSGLTAFGGTKESPASLPGDSGSPVAVRSAGQLRLGGFICAGGEGIGIAFDPSAALNRFGLAL